MNYLDLKTKTKIRQFESVKAGMEFENQFKSETWLESNQHINIGLKHIAGFLDRLETLIEKYPKEGLNKLFEIGYGFALKLKGKNRFEISNRLMSKKIEYADRKEYLKEVWKVIRKQVEKGV